MVCRPTNGAPVPSTVEQGPVLTLPPFAPTGQTLPLANLRSSTDSREVKLLRC